MFPVYNLSRRRAMSIFAAASLTGGVRASAAEGDLVRTGSRSLVVYFSRSGNTRVVAGLIHRGLKTDLFEIRPAMPYPEDYLQTVERARQERDKGIEPALAAKLSNISSYERIFLGFPIWGETAPPVIRSFLSAHDLPAKTLIPFVTHGGYGLGNSLAVLAEHAPKARLREGFLMEGEQERRTMDRVNDWLDRSGARR